MKKAYKSVFGQDEKGNLIFERYDAIRDKYRHIKLDYHKIRKIIINLMEGYDMTDILDMYKDDTIEDNCRVIQDKDILTSFENNDYLYMFQTFLKRNFDNDECNNKKLIELCLSTNKKIKQLYDLIIDNKDCFNNKQEFIDYSKIKIDSNEEFQILSNFLNEYKNDFSDFCYNNNVDITWINLNHFYISPCDVPRVLFDNFYKIVEEDSYNLDVSNILFEFLLTYYAGEFHSRKMLDSILKNIGKNPCAINTFVDLISNEDNDDTELNDLYSFEEEFGKNPIEILIEILENVDKSFDVDSLFGNYVHCYTNLNAFNANIVREFEFYKNERRI